MAVFKNTLEDNVVKTFLNLYSLLELIIRVKSDDSLTLKESYLLLVVQKLAENKQNSVSNIASELNLSNPSVSLAITSLVKKKYLTREHSVEDRRIYIVSLTDKAKEILEAQAMFRQKILQDIMSELSLVEKSAFQITLNKLSSFIDRDFERIKKDKTPIVNKY
jgi:DNA-binding MarR family transcriptional regulator